MSRVCCGQIMQHGRERSELRCTQAQLASVISISRMPSCLPDGVELALEDEDWKSCSRRPAVLPPSSMDVAMASGLRAVLGPAQASAQPGVECASSLCINRPGRSGASKLLSLNPLQTMVSHHCSHCGPSQPRHLMSSHLMIQRSLTAAALPQQHKAQTWPCLHISARRHQANTSHTMLHLQLRRLALLMTACCASSSRPENDSYVSQETGTCSFDRLIDGWRQKCVGI